MQVYKIDNKTNFGQRLKLDNKTITMATKKEKSDLASIKYVLKNNGVKGNIKVLFDRVFSFRVLDSSSNTSYSVSNNGRKICVSDIINHLKTKFNSKY